MATVSGDERDRIIRDSLQRLGQLQNEAVGDPVRATITALDCEDNIGRRVRRVAGFWRHVSGEARRSSLADGDPMIYWSYVARAGLHVAVLMLIAASAYQGGVSWRVLHVVRALPRR